MIAFLIFFIHTAGPDELSAGGVMMVLLSFSIHTAGPDELFDGGDDGVSYIFHSYCRS